jgi:hypothetical protein
MEILLIWTFPFRTTYYLNVVETISLKVHSFAI